MHSSHNNYSSDSNSKWVKNLACSAPLFYALLSAYPAHLSPVSELRSSTTHLHSHPHSLVYQPPKTLNSTISLFRFISGTHRSITLFIVTFTFTLLLLQIKILHVIFILVMTYKFFYGWAFFFLISRQIWYQPLIADSALDRSVTDDLNFNSRLLWLTDTDSIRFH